MATNFRPLVVFLASVIALAFPSCAKKELFRNSTPMDYQLSQEDLRLVQYYITSNVVLKRTERKKETGVTNSNILKAEESIYSKEITVDAATAGAAVKVTPRRLSIAFERGLVMDFAPMDDRPTTPYSLIAVNGTPISKSGEAVLYQGRDYLLTFGTYPMLNYKFTTTLNEKKDKESVKGMTVEEMLRLEREVEAETRVGPQSNAPLPAETKTEIPLSNRRIVNLVLSTGQRIKGYLVAESESSYFISNEIDPKGRTARISKAMVSSSDIRK
jgi:hypothetical protein